MVKEITILTFEDLHRDVRQNFRVARQMPKIRPKMNAKGHNARPWLTRRYILINVPVLILEEINLLFVSGEGIQSKVFFEKSLIFSSNT